MQVYRNLVFLTICEVTVKLQPSSLYQSHLSYCKGLYNSIMNGNLSKWEKRHVIKIMDELELIYAMTQKDANLFIIDFLGSDKIIEFETVVKETNMYYPFNGG